MNRLEWTNEFLDYADIPEGPFDQDSGVYVNVLGFITWINSVGSNRYNSPLTTKREYETMAEGMSDLAHELQHPDLELLLDILMHPTSVDNLVPLINLSRLEGEPTLEMAKQVRISWPSYAIIHVRGD